VAGTLGAILTGVFADPSVNEAGRGLLYGNPAQVVTQLIAAVVTALYAGLITFAIFKAIDVLVV